MEGGERERKRWVISIILGSVGNEGRKGRPCI